jgi:hypothetical protein
LDFDPTDELHVEFIFSCANLFASIFNLPPIINKIKAAKFAAQLQLKKPERETIDPRDPNWERKNTEREQRINDELIKFLQCKN